MKKVFLTLAVIATLFVTSCRQTTEKETVVEDSTEVEIDAVEVETPEFEDVIGLDE